MLVIRTKTEKMYYFDCDDTLVMWGKISPNTVEVKLDNTFTEYLVPHKKHIELLKSRKEKGDTIVVWSAGGYDWAEAVVKALEIEEFVDIVMSKPFYVIDDLPVNEMHRRIYLEFEDETT